MSEKDQKTTDDLSANEMLGGIYKMLKDGKAPAQIGKPVYAKDLDWAKLGGAKGLPQIFGQKINEKSGESALPLNFGSKKETGYMPDDVRLRLFHLKKMVNNVEIQSQVMFKGQHVTPGMIQETPMFKDHLKPMLKAFDITDFSNWIPTVNARFYFEEYELPFMLADQFDQQPMDSATVEVPGDLGHLEGREETDSAVFNSQSTTQANYSVTARNNVTHTQITEDLMQDSAPKIIEKLRRDVLMGGMRAYERALINGDTTVLTAVRGDGHQDLDTRALALNATFAKAFDGLRKRAFANNTALGAGTIVYDHGGDTASKTLFEVLLSLMGKFASEKDDLLYILPPSIENQLVTGAIPELFTAFAFGGLASNVTGQVPPVFGVKPVTSQYMREDLKADGTAAADPSSDVLTNLLLVKKSRFANFIRQATRVWAAPSLPSSDIMLMTSKTRHAFGGNPQSADEKSVVMGINIARS